MQELLKSFSISRVLALLLVTAVLSACGAGDGSSLSSNYKPGPVPGPAPGPVPGAATGTYLVSWDAVPDPGISGYKVYYSTNTLFNGIGVNTVTTGTTPSYTFKPGSVGITSGATVYVAVVALASGVESPLSDQISVIVQ